MPILDEIILKEGVLPPRPTSLRTVPNIEASSYADILLKLLEKNTAVAFGGVSLMGGGCVVSIIGVLQVRDESLKGWILYIGHPKIESDLIFIDSSLNPLEEDPLPNTIIYFATEAAEDIIKPDAPQEEVKAIARFILPFISDEGPPEGIDWK